MSPWPRQPICVFYSVLFCSPCSPNLLICRSMSKSYKNLLPAASRCAVDDQRHLRCPLGHRASSNSLEQRQAGRGVRNCLVGGLKGRWLEYWLLMWRVTVCNI